jgi:hypothetical protein
VSIDTLAFGENLHADPANMGLTAGTGNMVASFVALDMHVATRTAFHVMALHPLLESIISILVHAIETRMAFDMTMRTDSNHAGGTLKDCALGCCAIYLFTVWRRTIVKFFGPGMNVRMIRRLCNAFKLAWRKKLAGGMQGNELRAASVAPEAR